MTKHQGTGRDVERQSGPQKNNIHAKDELDKGSDGIHELVNRRLRHQYAF
jgi:hypothetical protein